MKHIKRILAILLVIIIVGGIVFKINSDKLVKEALAIPIANNDFASLADGERRGSYQLGPVSVEVRTLVQEGVLEEIEIIEHQNGFGSKAEALIDNIIKEQSLQVDTISGATVSSVAIKQAIDQSLSQ